MLDPKREKFCHVYIETGSQSKAFRAAFSCNKWKNKTVWERASRLLAEDKVQTRVRELQAKLEQKSDITKDRILKELENIAFADIRDFLEIKGGVVTIKDSSDWTDEMASAVESVKQGKEGIELKLNGKSWSIDRICKMYGYDAPKKIDVKQTLLDVDTGIDDE